MRCGAIALLVAGLAAASLASPARAAEAAPARIEARLLRDGFAPQGEMRRKGEFLILQATRGGGSFLLVIDRRTGEIIGQRTLSAIPVRD